MIDARIADLYALHEAEIETLLQLLGIGASYIDYGGNTVVLDIKNRLAIMQLMGVNFCNEEELRAAIHRLRENTVGDIVAQNIVAGADTANLIALNLPRKLLEKDIHWSLTSESESHLSGSFKPMELAETQSSDTNGKTSQRLWELPALDIGYYTLRLSIANRHVQSFVLVAPPRCYTPHWQIEKRKLGGISTQLYSLRSARNWGMGDYSDLQELIRYCASTDIDFIVLNPLHALNPHRPELCSPYSPHDRRFLNPLYLDLEIEEDFIECDEAQQFINQSSLQARIADAREADLVDYSVVAEFKQAVFDLMFKRFSEKHLNCDSARAQTFRVWVSEGQAELEAFAKFEAHRSDANLGSSLNPEFHCYLQWLSQRQLESCQRLATSSGMAIGLVLDLAVGSSSASAEVQLNPGLFNTSACIGAPPDSFAPDGQNWGLPPLDPLALQRTQFRHFIELLRSNMANCGALRIDHILALVRLWWCPGTDHSGHGAYVEYPVDVLFAILRIESQMQHCIVIGEDLGVVPPKIRQHMDSSGVFGSAIFYFEKYDSVHFTSPVHFRQNALTMVTNHDVPTLAAWWNKSDIDLRDQLGLYEGEDQVNLTIGSRESDLIQALHWLDDQALLPDSWQDFNIHRSFDCKLSAAIICANARSSSQLVSLQLEDLCLVEAPVNIPGTAAEYPNWRRKLPVTIAEIFSDVDAKSILQEFAIARQ